MHNLPISEAITAIIAALIAWFSHGKLAAKSSNIDNTKKLIELWEMANRNCQEELAQMRIDISDMRVAHQEDVQKRDASILQLQNKVAVLQKHVEKIEALKKI